MDDYTSILWLAVEDYAGLWEAVWQLRALHPEADVNTLTAVARFQVAALIRDGLAVLYRCQEPYGELVAVGDGEADELLQYPRNWREPEPNSVSIRFSATSAGNDAYNSRS